LGILQNGVDLNLKTMTRRGALQKVRRLFEQKTRELPKYLDYIQKISLDKVKENKNSQELEKKWKELNMGID